MPEMRIRFKLNGKEVEATIDGGTLLLELLRDRFNLTGTKYACGVGECGACTVLIDGEPYLSCMTLAAEVDGREVTTVEGTRNRFPEHLAKEAGVQCGYCTPGFTVMAEYLPKYSLDLDEEGIKKFFAGNVCRCTGYVSIIKAARSYLQEFRSSAHSGGDKRSKGP